MQFIFRTSEPQAWLGVSCLVRSVLELNEMKMLFMSVKEFL